MAISWFKTYQYAESWSSSFTFVLSPFVQIQQNIHKNWKQLRWDESSVRDVFHYLLAHRVLVYSVGSINLNWSACQWHSKPWNRISHMRKWIYVTDNWLPFWVNLLLLSNQIWIVLIAHKLKFHRRYLIKKLFRFSVTWRCIVTAKNVTIEMRLFLISLFYANANNANQVYIFISLLVELFSFLQNYSHWVQIIWGNSANSKYLYVLCFLWICVQTTRTLENVGRQQICFTLSLVYSIHTNVYLFM